MLPMGGPPPPMPMPSPPMPMGPPAIPMGPPPVGEMGAPPPMMPFQDPDLSLQIDPTAIMDLLMQAEPKTFKPKYPPDFKKPKRPKIEGIWAEAKREESRNQERVARQMETVRRLRFEINGAFDRDKPARDAGDQDEWYSSDLIDDNNLLCSIGSSFDEYYQKKILNRGNQVGGQTMEDFAKLMREEMEYRWAETGDMPLRMAEWKILTVYGQIVWRVLCNLKDPDFPFDITLVDPASFYPIYGGTKGLKKAFRMMRMTYAQACAEWGEPKGEDAEKIRAKRTSAKQTDETHVITVCEYADTWYRAAVTSDGVAFLPVTEHKYGYVPFVIQGGPGGEPLFTDTRRSIAANGQGAIGLVSEMTSPSEDWGMKHKLVSSITMQQQRHDQLEAVMARAMTAIDNASDPAFVLYRDQLLLNQPTPKVSNRRGSVNVFSVGDKIEAMPSMNPPMDMEAVIQFAGEDKKTGSIPLGMYGQQTGSQQTGNSMSVASEQGMDHITPWIKAMETGLTRIVTMCNMNWRNWGHLSRFKDGEEKPFMVPKSKPTTRGELANILTPELIDNVGPRVMVTMTRVRTQELLALANAASQLVPLGMPRRRMFEKMGEHDYDRMREEWIEEMEWDTMQQDEELRHAIKIPLQIKNWADQAPTEEERAMYLALLDFWMERQQAQMQPPPMGMPGSPPPPGMPPPAGPPMGGAPAPPPGGPQLGPGSQIMNVAGLGMPPGSQGAPVGRPPIF